MDKNNLNVLWSDCSSLNHGPRSKEHESRFALAAKPECRTGKRSSAVMINGVIAQNLTNERDIR